MDEYLRRNLLVAKAIGIRSNAEAAKKRMLKTKKPQKWIIAMLEGIIERAEQLPGDLAKYRDEA